MRWVFSQTFTWILCFSSPFAENLSSFQYVALLTFPLAFWPLRTHYQRCRISLSSLKSFDLYGTTRISVPGAAPPFNRTKQIYFVARQPYSVCINFIKYPVYSACCPFPKLFKSKLILYGTFCIKSPLHRWVIWIQSWSKVFTMDTQHSLEKSTSHFKKSIVICLSNISFHLLKFQKHVLPSSSILLLVM